MTKTPKGLNRKALVNDRHYLLREIKVHGLQDLLNNKNRVFKIGNILGVVHKYLYNTMSNCQFQPVNNKPWEFSTKFTFNQH